ncbi:PAS domain S-box protein [Desulfovibrio aminophilus]|uniref:sensor histidine kinase n=1 Tax=Desulfovibrio aminophilus TaxID=81425 RepID=UPI003391DF65
MSKADGADTQVKFMKLLVQGNSSDLSLFRAFFDAHAAPMALIDPDTGAVAESNRAAREFYGLNEEQSHGLSVWDITTTPLEEVRKTIKRLMTDSGGRVEALHLTGQGDTRCVEILASPVEIKGRRLLLCVIHDVTESRRAEAEVEHQRILRRTMIDSVRDAIALKDASSVYLAVNRAFRELLGRPESEILGRDDSALFPQAQAEIMKLDDGRVLLTGESVSRDECLDTPAGAVWTNTVKSPVRDDQGRVTGIVLAVRDITRRKQAEDALRKSEEEFRAIADYGHDWESWLSPKGALLWVNPAVERHTGFSVLECLAMADYPLPLVDPEDREALGDELRRAREEHSSAGDRVFRVRRKDGRRRYMSASWQPIENVTGTYAGLRLSVHDFTERRQADLLREDIERIVRHDLKGPLSSLLMTPTVLRQEGPVNERQEVILKELERSARRLLTMIDRSLDLYKMETGVYQLAPESLDLAALACEALEDARIAARPSCRWTLLVDGLPDDGRAFTIQGEERLLRTLLDNLACNAFEAAPENSTVVAALSRRSGSAVLEIANQGEIPPEIRDRLFEKYATAGKRHGTGLGTYSARLVAQAHGGTITADSSKPGRTTIRVSLPDPAGPAASA